MNPFDLHGPEFLLFYLVLSIVVIAVVIFRRRARESGDLPANSIQDPYRIAYLRGGKREVVKLPIP